MRKRKKKIVTIYLLHFDRPLAHARHYLGSAADLDYRLSQHRAGTGARLTQVLKELGIGWVLARTWLGPRQMERDLKDQRNAPRLCPICIREKKDAHPVVANPKG